MPNRNKSEYPFVPAHLPRLLAWAMSKDCFAFMNGNRHRPLYGAFPTMVFAGSIADIRGTERSFEKLQHFIQLHQDWLYGYLSYELKNEIEELSSSNPASIAYEHLHFMVPETIILIGDDKINITTVLEPDEVFDEIKNYRSVTKPKVNRLSKPFSLTSKKKYFERIGQIKEAIVEGEYYEMNYCIEYLCKTDGFDALQCYLNLNALSPMPFSCLMKQDKKYLICASPERFLKKEGNKIISQPIKGTIKRSFDKDEDESLKQRLLHSEKERAENLMIVDLVRNDLAKSAVSGTVRVDELFGIYSFKKSTR